MPRLPLIVSSIALMSVTGAANAVCPKSLVGMYSYTNTRYLGDGSVQSAVGVVKITSSTAAAHLYEASSRSGIDGKEPEQEQLSASLTYTFNTTTCSGTFSVPDTDTGLAKYYFVVSNGGNTISTIDGRGPYDESTFFSGITVLTKQ